MKASQIKLAALKQFVDHGYTATSLANIADEVGLKKQSIYSHFTSKDELFLTIHDEAVNQEIAWLNEFFEKSDQTNLEELLYNFLLEIKDRFLNDYHLGLLLRMAFYPPAHLYDKTMTSFQIYLNHLEELLLKEISASTIPLAVRHEHVVISYLNLLDGLIVELIYQGIEKFYTRLEVSWKVYWRGITAK